MGAHLEAQATKMRAIFVVIALSLIATAFTSTHEEGLSEATELIATMKKKGATEADCKDLAKTTCKEVLSEAKKAQKIIDSQSSGAECDRLGQRTVIYATRHYHKRMTQWRIAKKTITTLSRTKINLGVKTFISLKPGKCGFIFSSRIYRSTYHKYTRAVRYERTVRGWVIESKKALHRVRIQQKKMQEKCRCSVVKRRDSIWRRLSSRKTRARQLKALQKCKMMQCVLKGIKTSDKRCRATLPSLRNKVLSRNTEHAKRSGICRRHAKENHLKGERKSKSRARERKAKQIRKEKSAKAVRREKSAKALRRERAAKARAREQKAKHHEKRAKAAERSSKERSGKRERSHKARLRVERANKSKIRARRHWWHGNINGWDGHMNWSIGGTTYISGLQSWHNNGREDRIFRPLLTTIGAGQYGRQWSGWVNNMDAYFAYSCPNNKAMVGMLSYHHNGYEDRRWRFMCAGFHGVGFRKGGWPGWQTNWDAHFALSCGHNPVVGFSSYHNNHREDRRWRQQCGHRYNRM